MQNSQKKWLGKINYYNTIIDINKTLIQVKQTLSNIYKENAVQYKNGIEKLNSTNMKYSDIIDLLRAKYNEAQIIIDINTNYEDSISKINNLLY